MLPSDHTSVREGDIKGSELSRAACCQGDQPTADGKKHAWQVTVLVLCLFTFPIPSH